MVWIGLFDSVELLSSMLTAPTDAIHKRISYMEHASREQNKDSRIRSLESDNQSLRAAIDSATRGGSSKEAPQGCVEDFVPRVQHDTLQSEYERVSRARDMLESKCRRYKEVLKEWREYEKIWIMRKGPRSSVRRGSEHRSSEVGRYKLAAIPAPPMPPEAVTPTPSHSVSEAVSPVSEAGAFPMARPQHSKEHDNRASRIIDTTFPARRAISAPATEPVAKGDTEASTDTNSQPTNAERPQRSDNYNSSHTSHPVSGLTHDEDDVPIIVSERSLKRKRIPLEKEANIEIHVDTNVKEELISSSPVTAVSSRPLYGVQDSLDLDDIGQSMNTPKKRRQLEQMRLLSSLGVGSRGERSPRSQGSASQLSEDIFSGIPLIENGNVKQIASSITQNAAECSKIPNAPSETRRGEREERRQRAMRIAGQDAFEAGHSKRQVSLSLDDQHQDSASCINFSRHDDIVHGYQIAEHQNHDILRPRDPNILPRTNAERKRPVPSSRRDRGAVNVRFLAEDGEESVPSKTVRRPSYSMTPLEVKQEGQINARLTGGPPRLHRRLSALLSNTSPEKAVLPHTNVALTASVENPKSPSTLPKGHSVHRAKHDFFTTPISKALQQPHHKTLNTLQSSPVKEALFDRVSTRDDPPVVLPEQEPLRVRSVDRLRLTDFKLNKNHSEFAFHESIRKHDEKRKVGGCVDPFCDRCKEISRFAELTEYVAPPTSSLFGSSPVNAEATEQQLLEEFLGYDKQRLERLKPGERKEILKKARERSFADMYGKHRQIRNRAVSPPGYWETEFPSTQQEADNREAARVIERVKVRERYNEAIRGGLWKFADE